MATSELESTLHVTATHSRMPAGSRLVVFGDGVFRSVLLPARGDLVLGRAPEVDVPIDHPSVSRRHARLRIGPPTTIEDLASHNGVRVRGARLEPKVRTPVFVGDAIRLGSIVCVLQGARATSKNESLVSAEYFDDRIGRLGERGQAIAVYVVRIDPPSLPLDLLTDAVSSAVRRGDLVTRVDPETFHIATIDDDETLDGRARRLRAALLGIGAAGGVGTASGGARAIERARSDADADRELRDPATKQLRAIAWLNLSVALFGEQRREEARAVADHALASLDADRDASVTVLCLMNVGLAARETGDEEAARRFLAAAERVDARAGKKRVASVVASAPNASHGTSSVLSVDVAARTFRIDGGDAVALGRKRVLWLIFSHLVDAWHARPGESVHTDKVLAIGWPGEKIHPEAAKNRLYVAMAALRKAGLRDVLLNRDEGYLLDPRTRVEQAGV